MKTNLLEDALDADFLINNLALEAHLLESVFEQHFPIAKPYGSIGLESEDEEVTEKQKSVLEKVWDFIIRLLTAVGRAVVKFFKNVNISVQRQFAERVQAIIKNKAKGNIKFAQDVVKQMSSSNLSVISAIEVDSKFIPDFMKNVELDRKINVSSTNIPAHELATMDRVAVTMEEGVKRLTDSIAKEDAKGEEERAKPLLTILTDGLSINGSENGAYFKAFEKIAESEKKFDKLTAIAEEFKKQWGGQFKADTMKRVATAMSKQFSLEARVVGAYIKLNQAIIAVNERIYEGVV